MSYFLLSTETKNLKIWFGRRNWQPVQQTLSTFIVCNLNKYFGDTSFSITIYQGWCGWYKSCLWLYSSLLYVFALLSLLLFPLFALGSRSSSIRTNLRKRLISTLKSLALCPPPLENRYAVPGVSSDVLDGSEKLNAWSDLWAGLLQRKLGSQKIIVFEISSQNTKLYLAAQVVSCASTKQKLFPCRCPWAVIKCMRRKCLPCNCFLSL